MNAIAHDWRTAPLSAIDHALCAYAEKITCTPSEMNEQEVQHLRDMGLTDRAIHDATQVISYFNYINRIADTLGIENETFVRHWGEIDFE